MPSFDYQKKIKHKNFWKKKKEKKNCRALLFKMLKLRVLDLFFHWNKCFCYYTESKVPKKVSITRLFSKLPFWKSFLALCKANDAKATIVSVCFHWCGLHEWSWIGMWWLKVAYESNVSRSLQFVELIITSGTYNVSDSMPCTIRPAMCNS